MVRWMGQVGYQGLNITLSDRPDQPIFFVLGVRKSGSSIFNNMVRALGKRQDFTFVDIPGQLFQAGLQVADWQHDPLLAQLLCGGNIYGGFRDPPLCLNDNPMFTACRKVLLVRDPRDALVSEYFSSAFSHSLPQGGPGREVLLQTRQKTLETSIADFVLRHATHMARTLMQYSGMKGDPLLKLFRYEEVIMHKRVLLAEVSEHFGWPIDRQHMENILGWADVFPQSERPFELIRQVRPGDHREKLTAATIAELNRILAEPLHAFGYPAT
jgi:hypothetical protein